MRFSTVVAGPTETKRGPRKLPRKDPVVAGLVKRWIIVLRRTLAEDKAVWRQKFRHVVQGYGIVP